MMMTNPINIRVKCIGCGDIFYVIVERDDYIEYTNGALAQNCFPYLTIDDRELLISGLCPSCWDDMKDDEDEEY